MVYYFTIISLVVRRLGSTRTRILLLRLPLLSRNHRVLFHLPRQTNHIHQGRGSALTRALRRRRRDRYRPRLDTFLVTLVRPLRLRLLVEFRQVRGGYLNPKFPDREVPLGKRSRPGPVFARCVERDVVVSSKREREREKERRRRQRRTPSVERDEKKRNAPTIGTPRSLLSERITKDFSDDDDVVDFDRDDEVLLRSPVGRPRS